MYTQRQELYSYFYIIPIILVCKDTTIAVNGITVNALPIASFNPSLMQTTVIDGQVEFYKSIYCSW